VLQFGRKIGRARAGWRQSGRGRAGTAALVGVDEAALLTKLRAADAALAVSADSRRELLAEWRQREPDIEWRCSVPSTVSQRVFGAVCLRYGLIVYVRRRGTSTICVRAPRGFVKEVLWPEFEAITHVVEQAVCDAVERVLERWSEMPLGIIKQQDATRA
jgi:hypothetical protein